ncbi:hypothetical protein H920_15014 [Fukomys damarensis]|uniref:Uncharacterized protein n=1 Tax=Fukomys damarensis TaxID=885580 RepID=A0A091D0V6_FUKDA|nr:hypothetical protein H920_15014 [Fukomys damarensis]
MDSLPAREVNVAGSMQGQRSAFFTTVPGACVPLGASSPDLGLLSRSGEKTEALPLSPDSPRRDKLVKTERSSFGRYLRLAS